MDKSASGIGNERKDQLNMQVIVELPIVQVRALAQDRVFASICK